MDFGSATTGDQDEEGVDLVFMAALLSFIPSKTHALELKQKVEGGKERGGERLGEETAVGM